MAKDIDTLLLTIPQSIMDDFADAVRSGAKIERDRSLIELDPATSMRDVDLLIEDIESGLLDIVDLTTPGSTVKLFVLGIDGFDVGADWRLG